MNDIDILAALWLTFVGIVGALVYWWIKSRRRLDE